MTREVLRVEALVKSFGPTRVIDGIGIGVGKGELVTFLGPSGCGKTTLLRLIGGFLEPDGGAIFLEDRRVDHLPPERRQTAMVFQSYALFPHLTVFENVAYGLRVRRLGRAEIERRVAGLLEIVKLSELARRKPHQLSGGQQQRVAIARALSVEPKVLLLDEPLSNLDVHLRLSMRHEIRRLQRELNLTVCLVTHDQEEALSMSDRIAVLRQGCLEQVGTPSEIYFRPRTDFVARFIGQVNLVPARLAAVDAAAGLACVEIIDGTRHELVARGRMDAFAPGDLVYAVLRPDGLGLHAGAAAPGLPARVDDATFLGVTVRYHVSSAVGRLIVDVPTAPGVPPIAAGDIVTVVLPRECHVLHRAP